MSNYYEGAVLDVTDPAQVGVAFGNARDGTERVCVGLGGDPIEPYASDPEWRAINWIALTEECARDLYELLAMRYAEKT